MIPFLFVISLYILIVGILLGNRKAVIAGGISSLVTVVIIVGT